MPSEINAGAEAQQVAVIEALLAALLRAQDVCFQGVRNYLSNLPGISVVNRLADQGNVR